MPDLITAGHWSGMGDTTWHGRRLMRTSVSSWTTTAEDVDRSVEAVLRIARETGQRPDSV